MTAVLSVGIDRTSLTLSALTITEDFSQTYWIAGVEWPKFPRRKQRSGPSPYINGPGTLLANVRDLGVLPLTIHAQAATSSALETAKTALQAAVDQWTYTLTLTVDSGAHAYTAECADDDIAWGEIDSGMVRAFVARGSLVIPLYPS